MSTTKNTPLKSYNFWTGFATVAASAFAFFSISPDLSAATVLADEAHKAADAVVTKNYVALFAVVVNAGNILYHLFKK